MKGIILAGGSGSRPYLITTSILKNQYSEYLIYLLERRS